MLVSNTNSFVEIPLKAYFAKESRNKLLMSLKLVQKENRRKFRFLQKKEITLHQQVISQKRLATFYGDIGVGVGTKEDPNKIQLFRMLFDTGSCEFWIPSLKCNTSRCASHQRYEDSNTFSSFDGAVMAIQYLSGKVQGDMARETIGLGDLIVPDQIIGIATEVEVPLLDEVVWDGILGLAYPNQNLKNQKILPLFDNIMNQGLLTSRGEKNQFAYYLGPETGAITFGGADMKYKKNIEEEFAFSPISEENYWTINLRTVYKQYQDGSYTQKALDQQRQQKEKILCPQGCKTIVDTGTYLIYGPYDTVNNILADITIDSCKQKNQLPNIVFELFGENTQTNEQEYISLTMTPDDYVLHFKIDGVDDCVIGIVPDTLDQGWTLGQVFLRSFYTLFDRENNRIGFVRSNQSNGHIHQSNVIQNTPQLKQQPKEVKPISNTNTNTNAKTTLNTNSNSVNNVVSANEGMSKQNDKSKNYYNKRFVQLYSNRNRFMSSDKGKEHKQVYTLKSRR